MCSRSARGVESVIRAVDAIQSFALPANCLDLHLPLSTCGARTITYERGALARMTLVEVLTVFGLFFGPVTATLITFAVEDARRRRAERMDVARALLTSRVNIADPAYARAVNSIPVVFRDKQDVLAAWAKYMSVVNTQVHPEDIITQKIATIRSMDALTEMSQAVLVSIGFNTRDVVTIATGGYQPGAATEDRELQKNALTALMKLTPAVEKLGAMNQLMLAHLGILSGAQSRDAAPGAGTDQARPPTDSQAG
jgi:hypothetical protein